MFLRSMPSGYRRETVTLSHNAFSMPSARYRLTELKYIVQNMGEVFKLTGNVLKARGLTGTKAMIWSTLFYIFHPNFHLKIGGKGFEFFTCIYTEKCGEKQHSFFT